MNMHSKTCVRYLFSTRHTYVCVDAHVCAIGKDSSGGKASTHLVRPIMGRKLYLATERGFCKEYLAWIGTIVLAAFCAYHVHTVRELCEDVIELWKLRMLRTAHAFQWWSVVGLLSSSCCVIQVMLSFFQVGCASFNLYLGPLRPFTLAAATCMQAVSIGIALSRPWL